MLPQPPEPPDPLDPEEFARADTPPGALPPPAARPTSPELVQDLHARREWFAIAKSSSLPLVWGYLRHNWHDYQAQSWAAARIEAEAALAWRELGLRPAEAAELQTAGHEPEELGARWRRTGIPANEIADWIGAGLTPQEALDQRANGVTAEDAAVMRSLRSINHR
jgi:hypothetical protein